MKFREERLKNGVRLVHIPMPTNPAVTSMLLVNVGAEFERAKEGGISHFLEHVVFKGTEKRPKGINISRELDSLGASYNAFTSREYTGFYVKSAKTHFAKVAEVLLDMVLCPALREEDIDKERGVILEEINMYNDLPHEKVGEMFSALLYGDQPAGRDTLGTRETVSGLTRKDFVAFRRRHYTPENMVFVVAGGVSFEKAEKTAEMLFEEKGVKEASGKRASKAKVKKYAPESRVSLAYKKTDQTHFVLGGYVCDRHSSDVWPLRVLGAVLDGGMSGRIFQRIREDMGAAYYASLSSSFYSDHGDWSLSAGVTNARTTEVLEASLEELARVREELVEAGELKKAQDYMIGSLLLSLETSGSRARFYGFQSLFRDKPIYTPEMIEEKVRSITAEDLLRVANIYLEPKDLRLALIGPHRNAERFEKLLQSGKK